MKPVWRKSHTIWTNALHFVIILFIHLVAFFSFSLSFSFFYLVTIKSLLTFLLSHYRFLSVLVLHRFQSALLVVDNPSSKFRTIQDIKECKIPDTDFCISAGDGVDFYWNATIRPQYVVHSIAVFCFKNYVLFFVYFLFSVFFCQKSYLPYVFQLLIDMVYIVRFLKGLAETARTRDPSVFPTTRRCWSTSQTRSANIFSLTTGYWLAVLRKNTVEYSPRRAKHCLQKESLLSFPMVGNTIRNSEKVQSWCMNYDSSQP